MKVRFSLAAVSLVGVVCLGIIAGCGQEDQTPSPQNEGQAADSGGQQEAVDPHDVPLTDEQKQQMREATKTLASAVAKIKQFRNTVEQETKDGLPENPLEVHQALDKADLLVQWLPEIARDSGVPKEHWKTINTAANQLRELFEKVHLNIDSKADPDFASVEEQMDAKIAELQAIAQ
jgi:hypothetical protein